MDEEKPKKRKSNKMRNILIDLATVFVIAVIAIFAIVLLGQREGDVNSSGSGIQISGLHCSKSDVKSVFLSSKYSPSSALHEVRANFKDSKLTDIMYSYTATFPPRVNLSEIKTNLHINFDLAYGNAYVHRDGSWSESFSTSEEHFSAKMSIYSEAGSLRGSAAEVFGLEGSLESFPKTLSAMQVAYSDAGYACQVSE